jgi:hypothetical protein
VWCHRKGSWERRRLKRQGLDEDAQKKIIPSAKYSKEAYALLMLKYAALSYEAYRRTWKVLLSGILGDLSLL